jgi:hypothetical protein
VYVVKEKPPSPKLAYPAFSSPGPMATWAGQHKQQQLMMDAGRLHGPAGTNLVLGASITVSTMHITNAGH